MGRHFDLRVLASFLVLADELNFTRAAVRLHMTQPPLSLQIKQLEADLEVELFHRSKRGVTLTPAGAAFRIEAEKMFAQEDRARDAARLAGLGQQAAHLSIGYTPITGLKLMPDLLRLFTARMPKVRYSLKEIHSDGQRASLLSGELDIGFMRPPVIEQGLSAQLLFSEPHVLAVPAEHPLAQMASVHVRELHGQPLTMFERHTGRYAHDLFLSWLSQSGVEPAQMHDAVQHHAMMTMVSAGIGLAVVPASSASQPINGVAFKRLTGLPVPHIELWVAIRKDNPNPMAAQFLATALEHIAQRKSRIPP